MLTGRRVVLVTVTIAVVSLLAATLSITSTGKRELGHNTFGVRAHGHRGLFEILAELNFPAERAVAPPGEVLADETTLAFLAPEPALIAMEPAHLQRVSEWVQDGGTVVYAPADRAASWLQAPTDRKTRESDEKKSPRKSFWELMGIPEVRLSRMDVVTQTSQGDVELRPSAFQQHQRAPGAVDAFDSAFKPKSLPVTKLGVRPAGNWDHLPDVATTFSVPRNEVQLMQADETWPAATDGGLVVQSEGEGPEYWLTASFPLGAGRVIVVSDPVIAENGYIARDDNAVLMVDLLTSGKQQVVFDEFYHGLTARGNPLVLLQRPGFTTLLAIICATLMIYGWRHGQRLGPAIAPSSTPRRSLSEYIEAMARLFTKGRNRTSFLVQENRDGMNWMIHKDLGLPPAKHSREEVHALLARRDPKRADAYKACEQQLEELLRRPKPNDNDVLEAMKRVRDCL